MDEQKRARLMALLKMMGGGALAPTALDGQQGQGPLKVTMGQPRILPPPMMLDPMTISLNSDNDLGPEPPLVGAPRKRPLPDLPR